MKTLQIKRVYEAYSPSDGYRILVDRLWPRGVKKENAHVDLWLKDISPSTELRTWFNHEVDKWNDFCSKYLNEIANNPTASKELLEALKSSDTITLVYGAKDELHNQAVVIKNWVESQKY